MTERKNPWYVHPALLTVSMLYGGGYSVAKIALNGYVPPFGFALLRIFFAMVVLGSLQMILVGEKVKNKKDLVNLAICGLFGASLNQLLFLKGLSLTTAVNSSIIMTLIPVMVMIFSLIILKETIGKWKIAGLLLGLTGAVILLYKKDFGISGDTFRGDILNLLNAASYAVYLVLVKPLMQKYHPLTVIRWVFTFSFIFTFPFGISDVLTIRWETFTPEVWGSLLYVILAITILVYWLNIVTLKFVSPTVVGIYAYLQPVFAVCIALVFFDESFQLKQLLATLLIFSGVYFVSFKSKKSVENT